MPQGISPSDYEEMNEVLAPARERLRDWLESQGWSHDYAASRMGLHRQTIGNFILGHYPMRLQHLIKIAKGMGLRLDQLLAPYTPTDKR